MRSFLHLLCLPCAVAAAISAHLHPAPTGHAPFDPIRYFAPTTQKQYTVANATSRVLEQGDSLALLIDYGQHLLIGSRDAVYNVSRHSLDVENRFRWPVSPEERTECEKIMVEEGSSCRNHIRVAFPWRAGVVLCGSHALHPQCGHFSHAAPNAPASNMSAVGLTSPLPQHNAPFLVAGDHLYTAAMTDLSGTEGVFVRRRALPSPSPGVRSSRHASPFELPRFVALVDNRHEVLLFLTEQPEAESATRVSRVARVCKADPGGSRAYEHEWTSLVKAPLLCQIDVPEEETLQFNQLVSVASSSQHVFGAFRSQLAGLAGSAICSYPRVSVSRALSDPFSQLQSFREETLCPRAVSLEEQTHIRANPLSRRAISARPLFVQHGVDRFTSIAVFEGDKTETVFIGTDRGRVLKVAAGPHSWTLVASLAVTAPHPVTALSPSPLDVVVLSGDRLVRIPQHACVYAPTCRDCVRIGDSACGWLNGACSVTEAHDAARLLEQCPLEREEREEGKRPAALPQPRLEKEGKSVRMALLEGETPRTAAVLASQPPAPCHCPKTTCTTEVIQKEIHHTAALQLPPLVAAFIAGAVLGAGVAWLRELRERPLDKCPYGDTIQAFHHLGDSRDASPYSTPSSLSCSVRLPPGHSISLPPGHLATPSTPRSPMSTSVHTYC